MERLSTIASERGLGLIETTIATGIAVVGVVGLAGLFVVGAMADQNSRKTTYSTVLAHQKIEQLRGLMFAYDGTGLPVTDGTTDISVDPPVTGNACPPACGLIPGGSLGQNDDGYVDYLDAQGQSLGGGPNTPATTAYTRRWMITPHPSNPTNTLVIQVQVSPLRNRGDADLGAGTRMPNEARFTIVKTRKYQ